VPKSNFFHRAFGPRSSSRYQTTTLTALGQHLGGAVAVEVDGPGGLAGARLVDGVIRPLLTRLAGVLDPADVLAEVGARHEVGLAVAVDVDGQRGEVVEVRADARHVADLGRLLEVRAAIPGVARDDVRLAVVVHVEDPGGLERAFRVDVVLLPLRLAGSAAAPSAARTRAAGAMRGRGMGSSP
jgi:hypothetical protein